MYRRGSPERKRPTYDGDIGDSLSDRLNLEGESANGKLSADLVYVQA